MKREFLINITFLVFINLLIKPFFIFGIDRTVQNVVGPKQYGLYFALLNFTYLFQIINDFGIQQFNNRNISQHQQLLEKYFPNILVLKFFLSLVYFIFVFTFASFAGYGRDVYFLIAILAVNHVLISIIFFLRSNISGLAMYRTDSMISVIDKLLMIIIVGVLLWANPFSGKFQIEWFALSQTFSLFITALIALVVVKKQLKHVLFKFNYPFMVHIVKRSAPYALVIFLMVIYTRIDAVMIERMLPDGQLQAGIYASAYRLLDAVTMIGFLFASLLLPMFSRMIQAREEVGQLVKMSLQLLWSGAIAVAVSTFFFQKEVMFMLYANATPYWGSVLGYLILTFIARSGGTYIFGTLLTANGSMRKLNVIFVISIFLNIVLNYYLIQRQKAEGAAIATLITQFFSMTAQIIIAKIELKLVTDLRLVGKLVLFFVVAVVISFGIFQYGMFTWALRYFLSITAIILFAFLFRLINVKGLLLLLKSR